MSTERESSGVSAGSSKARGKASRKPRPRAVTLGTGSPPDHEETDVKSSQAQPHRCLINHKPQACLPHPTETVGFYLILGWAHNRSQLCGRGTTHYITMGVGSGGGKRRWRARGGKMTEKQAWHRDKGKRSHHSGARLECQLSGG